MSEALRRQLLPCQPLPDQVPLCSLGSAQAGGLTDLLCLRRFMLSITKLFLRNLRLNIKGPLCPGTQF